MLCTDCGQLVRPVVALDIDGTLGDYHGHFLKFAEAYLGRGRNGVNYAGVQTFRQWFCEVYEVDERTWRDVKLAYRQGGLKRSMPLYPGADRLCHAVVEAGAELWLTTTRPYLRLDNVDPDTRFWLERHSIEYHGLLYDENKYERLAEAVDPSRVVVVVDDLREQVWSAIAAFGVDAVCHRSTVYNQTTNLRGVFRTPDMNKVMLWALININQWRRTHA